MRFGVKAGQRGFTMIEMIIVMSIIMVLMAIALPMYNRSIQQAKEAKFKSNLSTLNEVIQRYSEDKRCAPQQLDDLVQAGYLKAIPDDITGSNTTWQTENEQEPDKAWNPDQMGIASAYSGSTEMSSDGRPYSEWR
ncbi:MAG: type II secretion system protein [Terriglobales bacterium]|jgi:general secretion pathway protein G